MLNNLTPFKLFIRNYWVYYRELEDEFLSIRKFVYFHKDNFSTYSVEFLKLYVAICSEIDAIGKAMASYVNDQFKANDSSNNIYKWWYEIQNSFTITRSYFRSDDETEIPLNCNIENFLDIIDINPWDGFEIEQFKAKNNQKRLRLKNCKIPSWWSDYNKVKHNRTTVNVDKTKLNYSKANLGNVCYALTALYTLEKAYMQKLGTRNELVF